MGYKSLMLICVLFCQSYGYAQQPQPLSGNDLYSEGVELFRKGQFGNAQERFDAFGQDESITKNEEITTSAQYFAALCAIKLYNKDSKSRVEKFGNVHELSPLNNRLMLEYANYRFSTKRYKEASEYYEKVDKFRLSGEDLNEFLFKKGYSLLMNEKNKEAKKIFFQLKDENSKYASSSKYYYAHLLYTDSSYAEALTNFLPLQNDESFGRFVPYYLAQIYYKLNDYDKLLEVGEELIEKATPKRAPEIAKLMADAFYKKKDYRSTLKYLELYKEKGGKMRQSDHFQLGYAYYESGQYQLAIESFNKITRGKSELKQNAFYHLGDCYLKVGDKQEAITAFKAASEIKESEFIREDAYFNYAKLVYELSDPYKDAITTLNDFVREFPNSSRINEVNRYLANLYLTTKDYDRALLALKRVGRATEVFNSLRYVEAIGKYNESLKYPVNRKVRALSIFWKGEAMYRLKKYDEALTLFDQFRNSPGALSLKEYTNSQYQTAYAHYKKFDFQKAASAFRIYTREANKKDPKLPDAYLRMADCYFLTGGYLIASDFYQSALKYKTKEADYAFFQKAQCLGLTGKRQAKISELNKLVKSYPNSDYVKEARYEIAETYLRLESYEAALSAYQLFMMEYPSSPQVVSAKMQIGLIYSNTDKNNEALSSFKKVVADYPGTDQSLEAIGLARIVYARLNRISDYLDWVEDLDFVNFKASTLDSTAYDAAFEIYSSGDCEQSLTAFSSYLERFERGIFALKVNYYTSECAEKLGKPEVAKKAYENITDLPRNEYSVFAAQKLADMAYQKPDFSEALSLYKKMAGMSDERSDRLKANTGVMRSAYKLGDYAEAAVYADLVLGMEDKNTSLIFEARDIGAMSNYKTENYSEALNQFLLISTVAEGESKARALYHIASIQYSNEEYDSSEVTIYKLIEDLPSFKEYKMKSLILLAKNFWKRKDIFQAKYTLDFVIKTAYSDEITKTATLLKEEIEADEKQQEVERVMQLQEAQDSVLLDTESGLLFSDDYEELEELEEMSDTTNNRID